MDKYIRTFAEINLDALLHNFNALAACVEKDVKLCAVIKADAYGHGAVPAAHLLEDKADYFAVATADEAIELRNAGIKIPILILSYTHEDDFEALIENNISMTVFTLDTAEKLQKAAEKLNKKALIHIAIDTGMTRIGFNLSDKSAEDILNISKMPNIEIQGIFSHYACADMTDKTTSVNQTEKFKCFVKKCESLGVKFPIHHLCNSAGISEFSEHFDMVRMGISLYGLYPSEEVDKSKVALIPAMTYKSHIIYIKDVPKGQGVSYGHIYKTPTTRKIATVAAGYADGYPRALSNKGRVIVKGCYAPIVGRVCMDQFMIDISDIPDVQIDDEVILWGTDGSLSVSAEEIGSLSMSFNYEVVCSVQRRNPRVYKKDEKTVGIVNYLR
ncbi:MAG: alanine racemase [Clostridiales bacterium]|nr:alanine racemase [Clostridiales bacterium]